MGQVRVEEVQADRKGKRGSEDADRESSVAGKDASCERCDADIQKAGSERLGVRDQRLKFTFDRALYGDPTVNERADRDTSVGCEVREASSCSADLALKLGLNRDDLDFGFWQRVDRELLQPSGQVVLKDCERRRVGESDVR